MQFTVLAGLFLTVFFASIAARPAPELPESPNLFALYRRLEMKLFETEKLRDVPPPNEKDAAPAAKEVKEPAAAQTGSGKSIGHLLNAMHARQLGAGALGK